MRAQPKFDDVEQVINAEAARKAAELGAIWRMNNPPLPGTMPATAEGPNKVRHDARGQPVEASKAKPKAKAAAKPKAKAVAKPKTKPAPKGGVRSKPRAGSTRSQRS